MYKTASYHHRQGQHLMHALLEKEAGKFPNFHKGDPFHRIGAATDYLTQRLAKGDGNPAYLRRMARKLSKIEERAVPKIDAAREADRVHFPIAGPPAKGISYSREAMQGLNPIPRRGFKTSRGKPMSREEIFRTLRNDAHSIHAPDGSSYTLDGRGNMIHHTADGKIGMVDNIHSQVPGIPASSKEMRKLLDRISNTQGGQGGWSYTPRGGVAGGSKKYYPEAKGPGLSKKRGKYEQRRK